MLEAVGAGRGPAEQQRMQEACVGVMAQRRRRLA